MNQKAHPAWRVWINCELFRWWGALNLTNVSWGRTSFRTETMSLTQTYGQFMFFFFSRAFTENQAPLLKYPNCFLMSRLFSFFTLFHVNVSIAFTLLTLSTTPNLFIKTNIVSNKYHTRWNTKLSHTCVSNLNTYILLWSCTEILFIETSCVFASPHSFEYQWYYSKFKVVL